MNIVFMNRRSLLSSVVSVGACCLLAGLAGCGGGAPSPTTTTSQGGAGGFGVLVMAHGGTPEWNAGVLDTVKPLRERYTIEVAFGMADAATIQEGIAKLEAQKVRRIGVVRLFVSGESWTAETEQILGLRPGAPPRPPPGQPGAEHPAMAGMAAMTGHGAHPSSPGGHGGGAHGGHGGGAHGGHSMEFFRARSQSSFALSTEGLADAATMGTILADRASALSKAPAREDVIFLAHGPGDDAENARWIEKLDVLAGAVRTRAPFRRVQVETLREDWPDKRVAAEKRVRGFVERAGAEGGKAIVIPFRVQGFGPYAKVLEGLDYVSDGTGLIPHAEVGKWIEKQIVALQAGQFRAPG